MAPATIHLTHNPMSLLIESSYLILDALWEDLEELLGILSLAGVNERVCAASVRLFRTLINLIGWMKCHIVLTQLLTILVLIHVVFVCLMNIEHNSPLESIMCQWSSLPAHTIMERCYKSAKQSTARGYQELKPWTEVGGQEGLECFKKISGDLSKIYI